MPELRRESRRVFGQAIGRKGSGIIRTQGDQALSDEDRERLNRRAVESWIAERRLRLARQQSNLRNV